VIVIRSGAVTIAASILPSLNETFFFFGLGFYWKQPPAPALDGYIYFWSYGTKALPYNDTQKSGGLSIHPSSDPYRRKRKKNNES
jgi:hypothetical protein